jgi:hypothetical protein
MTCLFITYLPFPSNDLTPEKKPSAGSADSISFSKIFLIESIWANASLKDWQKIT